LEHLKLIGVLVLLPLVLPGLLQILTLSIGLIPHLLVDESSRTLLAAIEELQVELPLLLAHLAVAQLLLELQLLVGQALPGIELPLLLGKLLLALQILTEARRVSSVPDQIRIRRVGSDDWHYA
jgi:hypothetical protein